MSVFADRMHNERTTICFPNALLHEIQNLVILEFKFTLILQFCDAKIAYKSKQKGVFQNVEGVVLVSVKFEY